MGRQLKSNILPLARRYLFNQVQGLGMMEWQPIETAPTDEPIFTWDGEDILYAELFEGVWNGTDGVSSYVDFGPTHWMPLPAAPVQEGIAMQQEITVSGNTGSYTIRFFNGKDRDDANALFLKNQDDEGMGLSEQNLFNILDEYFKREFQFAATRV